MLWPPLLSLLVLWCTGSNSQPVLTQPPSALVSPGKTATLSCVMSSGFSISSNYMHWFQKKPGSPPRYLLYYYSDSNKGRGSGVPSRFSASKDTSSNTFSLTIAGALPEDEAVYYCGRGHGSGSTWYIFGGGTTVYITGQPTVAPKVHLFPPSKEELESKSKATLVCLLQEFSPAAFQVTWVADGTDISNGVETTKATKVNDKYVASSYLTVSASDWKSHESFSCKVTHEGSHFMKSVSHSQCP